MGRDVWFALAIVLVLMLLGTADSPAQQDATYEEARRLFDAKEYRGAAGKFGEILETQPDYYWGWHSVGVCHWKLGELAEAERGLRRALELEPASFESSYVLGKVLYDGRAYEDSAVELERTVTLAGKPRQRDAASSALAESLFGAGKYEEARSVWEEQVAANGTAFRPRYMLGLTCRRLDDLACAVENLRWARDLKSGDSRLPRTVAELSAYRAAQTESGALGGEAVSDAQVWVRAAPKAPEARVNPALGEPGQTKPLNATRRARVRSTNWLARLLTKPVL
jgi:tetratricopeptide (TPR) repeat protein